MSQYTRETDENPSKFIHGFINSHFLEQKISITHLEPLKYKSLADKRQIANILLEIKCSLPRAMYLKDPLITEFMLDGGCDIHKYESRKGFTALHYGVRNQDVANVKLLLQRGADIYAEDDDYRTPLLHYKAGRKENCEMLITLLDHVTFLDAYNIEDYEFAAHVLEKGQLNEVEVLLRYDFDFEDNNSDGQTLLHAIAINKNRGAIQKLEGKRFDVNVVDSVGQTALWYVESDPSNFEFLFKHGADPNITDEKDRTAFYDGFEYWASNLCDTPTEVISKCVELFLEYGADVLYENDRDGTIFDISLEDKKFALIRPVIAKVAMLKAMGKDINECIIEQLECDERYENFFDLCRCKIEKLQRTMISRTVSLFQFFTESEEKLFRCTRNDKSIVILERIFYSQRKSKMFFVKLLRKRVQRILRISKLRKEAASIISRISGCGNRDVIDRIVLLLDNQSLKHLCQI